LKKLPGAEMKYYQFTEQDKLALCRQAPEFTDIMRQEQLEQESRSLLPVLPMP
jgi:hypothetical protein